MRPPLIPVMCVGRLPVPAEGGLPRGCCLTCTRWGNQLPSFKFWGSRGPRMPQGGPGGGRGSSVGRAWQVVWVPPSSCDNENACPHAVGHKCLGLCILPDLPSTAVSEQMHLSLTLISSSNAIVIASWKPCSR